MLSLFKCFFSSLLIETGDADDVVSNYITRVDLITLAGTLNIFRRSELLFIKSLNFNLKLRYELRD